MATYTSAQTGLFSDGATWVGGVKPPSAGGHKVVIAATHIVTFDEAAGTYGDDTSTGIQVNGTLKASRSVSTALTCYGDLFIGVNGTLDYGTEADPIPAAYTATIILNASATQASNKWGIRTDETANWAGIRFWGASKTAVSYLTATATGTDTTFAVANTTGWNIGDYVVFDCSVAENSATGQRYRAITNISGLNVTVGASLTYGSQLNRKIMNLSRNVKVYGLNGNTYKTHIAIRFSSTFSTANAVEIGPCELRVAGGHASNTYQFSGLNINWTSSTTATAVVKKIYGTVLHDIWSISGSTIANIVSGNSLINTFTNQYYNFIIENIYLSSNNNMSAIQMYNGTSVTYKNLTIFRCGNAITTGYSQGPVGCVIDGGYISGCASSIQGGTGISVLWKNVTFDFMRQYLASGASAYGSVNFQNCTFGVQLPFILSTNSLAYPNGSYCPFLLDNCTFLTIPIGVSRASSNLNLCKPDTYFSIRNANNDPLIQYKYTYAGEQKRDNSIYYRGASTISLDCWYSANNQVASRTFPVIAGQTVTIIGYLRFNTTYGTATPPSVTLSGLGITPQTFTAPATADTWHKFSLTVTNPQAYAGEFTLTVTGQSAANAISAYCWLDGIPWVDYVSQVRHYGYLFDTNVYRTVDPKISQATEATVAAYATIDTLDKLYDRLQLWACDNPATSLFYSYSGSVLDVGSTNVVVDASAASAFDYTGGTLTIKASTLADGSNFTKLKTSGTITKSNGAIISTVYESNLGTSAKLLIHLPLTGMSLCVHDNNLLDVEYASNQSGDYTLLIDPGATGTWYWAINKQGYVFATGSFTPATGGVFENSPSCPQVTTSEGLPMYQNTTSSLVNVSISGDTQMFIDIGDGTPPLQAIYDMVEDQLMTDDGIDWIIKGGDGVSIFNSFAGDFLFMTSDIRLRRWHPSDSNATVSAFAQSTDAIPVDESNGPVRYLTSDSPVSVANAVYAKFVEQLVINKIESIDKLAKLIPAAL